MARTSHAGLCADFVRSQNPIRRGARTAVEQLSSLRARARDALATCASAALPQVGAGRAIEPLEGRQLFSAQVANAGFEAPAVGANNFYAFNYDPTGTAWTYGGYAGVTGNGSGFTALNPNAPEGAQVGFLQFAGSTISQTVNFDAAGSYSIGFQAAQRVQWQAARQDFQVLVDGNVVGTFTPSSGSYASYSTGAFNVSAGAHTITFQGLDSAGGDNTAFIDNVQIGSSSLANTGFETSSVGSGSWGAFAYDPTNTGWTFAGNAGISGNNSGFTGMNPANAPEGSHVGFVQMAGSSISQAVSLTAGSYTIAFDAAQRIWWQQAQQDFQVLVDGNAVGTFTPAGGGGYAAYSTGAFTVASGVHTITFKGLDSAGGDNTAFIDAVQLTAAIPSTVPPVPASPPPPVTPGGANAPTAVINVQGGNGQVEHSVFVNGLNSPLGDGNSNTATYQWNFGDPSSHYNTLTGWNAGHIYDNPGTYTITLTVTNDLGASSTATTQVSITSASRTTIYVDNNGSDANSGLSPWQAIVTPTRLQQVLDSMGDSNVTVLFARGETFDVPGWINVTGTNEVFGAYGSGANPVIMKTPGWGDGVFVFGPGANQVVIENLTFDSVYTATLNNAPDITATAIYPNGQNITVRNNTFLNIEDAIDAYQGPNGLLVENNSAPLITGLRGYFVWMNGSNGVVLGNTVVNSTRQHILRSEFATTQDWLIAGNNFTGNSNPADPGEFEKTTINIRQGDHIYITGNTLTGATASFGPDDSEPSTAVVSAIKFDGNVLNNAAIQLHGSVIHSMISNNLTNLAGYYPQIAIQTADDMGRQMNDVTIEHNTGVLSGSLGYYIAITGDSPAGVLTIKDNLFAAPNFQPGYNAVATVYINGNSAAAVALFSHNVWAAATGAIPTNPGAVNYIAPAGVVTTTNFLTAAQWNALPNVQDDQFRTVSVGGSSLQVPIDGQMAGAVLPPALT